MARRFPRLYAAASLKRGDRGMRRPWDPLFSAALCRGLIEAGTMPFCVLSTRQVFRGFMPRPH